MEHKKQHWVPQSYLAAWCDPDTPTDQEPFLWMFPKDGGPGRRKAPKNIFHETDMYTIKGPEGARDLSLEQGLSGLEGMFAEVRREKLEPRVELDAQDRLVICAFVAAAVGRTRKQREHMRSQWAGVLEDMEAIREAMQGKSPKERSDLARLMSSGGSRASSLGYPEVKRLAEAPLQTTLPVSSPIA